MADLGDEIDCGAVVRELYMFLDGELTSEQRFTFAQHLQRCTDCHEVVDFHAELKLLISRKCRDQVPEGLEVRIRRSLGSLPPDLGGGIPRL